VVLVDGDDLPARISDALDGRTARLGLTGGTAVTSVASAVEDGGQVVAYAAVTGQSPVLPRGGLIFRGVSLHGLWMIRWLRSAPREEIEATYALLDRLTAAGVLRTDVDSTFPVEKYADAFARAAQGGRSGKVLFAG
jgi:NADPH:quinone reductase-like Zn-dependent oxidoreductase